METEKLDEEIINLNSRYQSNQLFFSKHELER